jgi:putative transposase
MVFHGEISRTPGNRLLTEHIDVLRAAFVYVKSKHPYYMEAVLVLPEHLHCILTLPDGDSDFSTVGD